MFDHDEALRRDSIRQLRWIPVVLAIAIIDVLVIIFLSSDDFIFTHQELPGVSKHLWILVAVLCFGTAIVCWLGAILFLIALRTISNSESHDANKLKVLKIVSVLIFIGGLLVWLYFTLFELIQNHQKWLNQKFYWKDYKSDVLWDVGVGTIALFLIMFYGFIVFGMLNALFNTSKIVGKTDA
jgi:arginine exporter protein ArgO